MKRKTTGTKRTAAPAKATKPKTHDDYLAAVTEDKRGALQKLRRAIKAAAPEAEECISYQLPAFRLNRKFLIAYGAASNHWALYPGSVVQCLKDELKDYDTSKGTIRFPADTPLPPALVRKLVELRIARIAGGPSRDKRCSHSKKTGVRSHRSAFAEAENARIDRS